MGEGRKDGGPAFPSSADFIDPQNMGWVGGGMSLRDWFAGQALAGLAAHYGTPQGAAIDEMPKRALRLADAMLAARGRTCPAPRCRAFHPDARRSGRPDV